MALTLREKQSRAIQIAFQLNYAIGLLEEAQCAEDVRTALRLIPNQVFSKIFNEIRSFSLHDITRADLLKVLKKQLSLRKRSMKRYLNMGQEKKDA